MSLVVAFGLEMSFVLSFENPEPGMLLSLRENLKIRMIYILHLRGRN